MYILETLKRCRTICRCGDWREMEDNVHQVFKLFWLKEKACERYSNPFVAFMDLVKAYGRANREGLWKVLQDV